jgi:tetratricopeptide (TPR) repeat protein
VWQELREELHPQGIEFVTVALDSGGTDAAAPFIDAANAAHPSLIDQCHVMDELFGVVNVPSGIWIDEQGVIVRPPEPAFPGRSTIREKLPKALPDDMDPYIRGMLEATWKIRVDPKRYVGALRDWIAKGSESEYALTPEQVLERSRPRTPEAAEAAARFELGEHLFRLGRREDAMAHFREARRLQPENWTYKRQAWSFNNPLQMPSDELEGDWLSDVLEIGPENYYPALDM